MRTASSALLVLACCAHRPPPIADEWAPPTDQAIEYPLAPTVRAAGGGPVIVVGDEHVEVPYARLLTLRTAIELSGQVGNMGVLVRGEARYDLPIADIMAHRMPDLQLAPGDVIRVREELCGSPSDHCD